MRKLSNTRRRHAARGYAPTGADKIAPRLSLLLARLRMSRVTHQALAEELGVSILSLALTLRALCAKGLARRVSIYVPARLGRPLHALTYVSLRDHDPAGMAAFETWCRDDSCITQAVLLAGRHDYALWTWHLDERETSNWRRTILQRPEVARIETEFVQVLTGHPFEGALIFRS